MTGEYKPPEISLITYRARPGGLFVDRLPFCFDHFPDEPQPSDAQRPPSIGRQEEVVVVAGCSAPLTLAITAKFVNQGARVFVVGARDCDLGCIDSAFHDDVSVLTLDPSRDEDIERVYSILLAAAGWIDILVLGEQCTKALAGNNVNRTRSERRLAVSPKLISLWIRLALPLLLDGRGLVLLARPGRPVDVSAASGAGIGSNAEPVSSRIVIRNFAAWVNHAEEVFLGEPGVPGSAARNRSRITEILGGMSTDFERDASDSRADNGPIRQWFDVADEDTEEC